jgi:hypothetical protein
MNRSVVIARLAAVLAIACGAAQESAGQGAPVACNVPELAGNPEYDALVCRGLDKFSHGRYAASATDFETALGIRLGGAPNYKLLARLAISYWRAGDRAAARVNLEKSRLSLMLLTGIYHCNPTPVGGQLVDQDNKRLTGPPAQDIEIRMCADSHKAYFVRTSLETFVADAKLIEVYEAARKLIR